MRKFGFTLAEVLISIAIVGVSLALTVPTFVKNTQRQVLANSLSTAISDFETAMNAMIIRDNASNIYETKAWEALIDDELNIKTDDISIQNFVNNISKLLKITYKKNGEEYYKDLEVKYLDGTILDSKDDIFSRIAIESSKGIVYFIKIKESNLVIDDELFEKIKEEGGLLLKESADIYIDLNGKKAPNTFGRDIFSFVLDDNGKIYPVGGKDYSLLSSGDNQTEHWTNKCRDGNLGSGTYCAGRVVENDYKMDY